MAHQRHTGPLHPRGARAPHTRAEGYAPPADGLTAWPPCRSVGQLWLRAAGTRARDPYPGIGCPESGTPGSDCLSVGPSVCRSVGLSECRSVCRDARAPGRGLLDRASVIRDGTSGSGSGIRGPGSGIPSLGVGLSVGPTACLSGLRAVGSWTREPTSETCHPGAGILDYGSRVSDSDCLSACLPVCPGSGL